MRKPRLDHVGIIVPDLARAVERFTALFPDGPSSRRTMDDVGLEVAKFEAENVTIELLAYTDGGSGFGRQTMGEDKGLNHLSLQVDDIEQAIAALGAAGFVPQAGFPRPGAHGTIAFFERDEETGVLLEVSTPDDDE